MPPEKSDLKYVWDMLDSARTVVEITAERSLADYEKDKVLRLAVERSIEIIGEAARRVSPAFRQRHADVAWNAKFATRHVIAHEYGDIQHDKIRRIVTIHAPVLIQRLAPIVDANPPGEAIGGAAP